METKVLPRRIACWGWFLGAIAIFIAWYVSCFFLMMDWRCEAYDPILDQFTHECSYYLIDGVRARGEMTFIAPRACWANSVFYPFDSLLGEAKRGMGVQLVPMNWLVDGIWYLAIALPLLSPFAASLWPFLRNPHARPSTRAFLWLVPALWYWQLYHNPPLTFTYDWWCKSIAVMGTAVAILAVVWKRHMIEYILAVPLLGSLLCGTVWLLVWQVSR